MMVTIQWILVLLSLLQIHAADEWSVLNVNSTIATCNFNACNSERISCSSNLNCDCFSLTSNSSVGICALATLSCESFVRCNMDNVTCSIDSTICVNSARCGKPICYPLPLANKQICPPKTVTTTTLRPTTTGKELCLANLKAIRTKVIIRTTTTKPTTKITTTTQQSTTITEISTTTSTPKGKICSIIATDSSICSSAAKI
ncbi:unnamed protein product [Adineta steineri]|uniref:Uncharacterized protein n=1 Tax=Adineta steineri TaxID=433720 RepID=A0A814BR38_9BILA|nr:unnamed protein product [Adineta steineri]CAF3840096.1 unnamed protein product [Adineta steineri]